MTDINAYESDFPNEWCPGCGNFGILAAMKEALSALGLLPEKVLIVSGIGQAAKTPHFIACNTLHSLHGRALPVATGAKIANHELTILVNTGDGDCYGEGGNHFLHAIRRNLDVTVLAHDNRVYGLTKGQASPTSALDTKTPLQPQGVISTPINPMAVALAAGAGFVARGFSGNRAHLSGLIQAGVKHRGFALIDILQPCVSFNRVNTHDWYKRRVYDLKETGYRPDDVHEAIKRAMEWEPRIPLGIFYRKETPDFTSRIPALQHGPLFSRPYDPQALQAVFNDE
jgi:2-oxoglutarate ferredoxin oxidoreductase subunit beta